jgi:glycerol-3-phosphate O-acyltransferase / dihydroxyacetone phosphate acyltransferase
MNITSSIVYRISRWIVRTTVGFYFSRIERFHRNRVPTAGPVLFTSNHPNSLTDAFVIGTSVPRKVNFVATVQLFRFSAFRWLLTRCGVIPVNRVKDDPHAMRSVMSTFESCFRQLEVGEAVAIFPEGVTHDDPQLRGIKTGTARMALEFEHRHAGKAGLTIVPVGLNFSAKEIYRSEVLVNFGDPLRVADWLAGYDGNRRECIQRLTAEIELRIAQLILHLPHLERARLVESVKRLYLERLRVGNRIIHEPVPDAAGELMLTQAVARAVDYIYEHHPELAARFTADLDHFERSLKRLHLSDEELAQFPNRSRLLWHSLASISLGLILFPIAAYGWVHRLLPYLLLNLAISRMARSATAPKTHVSTTTILAGAISFGVLFSVYIAIFQALFGFPTSLWYALSLPVASLIAHYYLRGLRRFTASVRYASIWLRAPSTARHLLALRSRLISEIETARWKVPIDALTHQTTGPP